MTTLPPRPTTVRAELRALGLLAGPIIVGQVGMSAMGFVDTVLVGPLGAQALSALALGNMLYFGLLILGKGTLMGLDAHISQAWGARDAAGCRTGLIQGMWLVAAISPPLFAAMTFAPDLLIAVGYDPEMAELARLYLYPLRWGAPISMLFTAHRSFLSAIDITWPLLISAVVANAANVGLDLWFIHGGLGLPPLGVEGVAWATALCRFAVLGPVALVAWSPARRAAFAVTSWRPQPETLRAIVGVGLPVGLQYFAEFAAFGGAALLMGVLGVDALASHQVALNVVAMVFMVPLALGSAGAVRAGQALGARDAAAVSLAAWTVNGVAVVYAGGAALLLFLLAEPIAGLYGVEGAVFTLSVELMGIAAVFQFSDSVQAVAVGVLRGLGDTRAAFGIALFGYGGFALPIAAYAVFGGEGDPHGVWWGLVAGLTVAAACLVLRIAVQVRRAREQLPAT